MLEVTRTEKGPIFTELSSEAQESVHQIHLDALHSWMKIAEKLNLSITRKVSEDGSLLLNVAGWLIEI